MGRDTTTKLELSKDVSKNFLFYEVEGRISGISRSGQALRIIRNFLYRKPIQEGEVCWLVSSYKKDLFSAPSAITIRVCKKLPSQFQYLNNEEKGEDSWGLSISFEHELESRAYIFINSLFFISENQGPFRLVTSGKDLLPLRRALNPFSSGHFSQGSDFYRFLIRGLKGFIQRLSLPSKAYKGAISLPV